MAFLNATAGAGKVARIVCTAAARPVCSRTAKADRESTRRSTYDQLPVTEVMAAAASILTTLSCRLNLAVSNLVAKTSRTNISMARQ